jgi:cytosine/adenosine deaminase-related metal-dependent hydrolase
VSLQAYHASWIVPIVAPPIRDGWVATDRGRVVAFGRRQGEDVGPTDSNRAGAHQDVDLGSVAVMPGLVNAHTHLELSWMRGLVLGQKRFPDWIRSVIAERRKGPVEGDAALRQAIREAIDECRRCGIVMVGDVANTGMTVEPLAASDLHAVIFRELIGFKSDGGAALVDEAVAELAGHSRSPNVRLTLAAHAPYSVSPPLFRAIKAAVARDSRARSSVHLGESLEELAFLERGGGPWRTLLEDVGVWDATWVAPACDPVEYLDRMGVLDDRLLCVHGVHLNTAALGRLARRGATIVTCPRGNRLTGAGSPPVRAFYDAGLRVAVGTDSLASVPDLNVFSELAELHQLAPEVPARMLLESATWQGARALDWADEFGTIEAGKRAALIAVEVPGHVSDVEQYLVGGIEPGQVRWVET